MPTILAALRTSAALSLRVRRALALPLALSFVAAVAAAPRSASADPSPLCYIATNGNDAWSGHLPAPNTAHTDGPFATLGRASRELASRTEIENRARHTLLAYVRGGLYSLAAPIYLAGADSGTAVTPILYAAYPGEHPVLSGGTRLTNWKQISPGRWETTIPDVAAGRWYFEQLYVNGERRYRPRLPERGYYYVGGELPAEGAPGISRFRYEDTAPLRGDYKNRADIEVLPFHIWEMSRFHVSTINPARHTLSFVGRSPSLARGYRFLLENVQEALHEPGQWYLDKPTGVLTYLTRRGEDPNRETIVAPRIERLLDIQGAAGISFRGLTFSDCAYNLPPQGHSDPQADINVHGALYLQDAQKIIFDKCTVRNVGGYAVDLEGGCQDCRITDCLLTDLGGGGVRIGKVDGWSPNEADHQETSRNIVEDCRITHGGRIHPAAVGVLIGHSAGNSVVHNQISDFYYTGISAGWSWGYNPSGTHDNVIAYNDIAHIGQGVLSETTGIYTLGVSPGTVLDHNRLHDIYSYDYGGWGICLAAGSTQIVATNNLVYDLKSEPLHQHYGTLNLVQNNILALGQEAQLRRSRGDNNNQPTPDKRNILSFTVQRNIVYSGTAPLFNADWSGSNFVLADNLYWVADDTRHPPKFPGNRTLEQWQAAGHDIGSIVADPLFVDPAKFDFALRPDSPAAKIGFVPIDLSTVGPRVGGWDRTEAPRAFPVPPPPQPIVDNFDETGVGQKPGGLDVVVNEETDHPDAYIRVTDEAALSGKHSLKFQDAPGQRFSYSPHLYYHPDYTSGAWTGSFALRLEPGAIFYHEWRDSAAPYNVGPTLRVGADGVLTASGKPLLTLPHSAWVRIAITSGLGQAANGKYELRVTLPAETQPHVFRDLPCGSGAAFTALNWWGFVADSTTATVFYIDDIALTRQ